MDSFCMKTACVSKDSHGGMISTGESRITRRKTYPNATFPTTNPIWTDSGANPVLSVERPTTNHLSHGTAPTIQWIIFAASLFLASRYNLYYRSHVVYYNHIFAFISATGIISAQNITNYYQIRMINLVLVILSKLSWPYLTSKLHSILRMEGQKTLNTEWVILVGMFKGIHAISVYRIRVSRAVTKFYARPFCKSLRRNIRYINNNNNEEKTT
jgi:hypothetical protein